jgi:hypothetical protein
MRHSWLVVPMVALMATGLLMPACITPGNDVDGCRQLEDARCVRAQSCGLDLQGLLPIGSSPADAVTACQLFYQDACLHGLVTPVPVNSDNFNGCLNAIKDPTSRCNYVVNPASEPECSWLNPPDAGVDASDGSTDATVTPDVIVVYVYPDAAVDSAVDASLCNLDCESTCEGDSNCITNCGC